MHRMCLWLIAACFGFQPVYSRGFGAPYRFGYPAYVVTPTGVAPIPPGPITLPPGFTTTTTTTFRPITPGPGNTFPPIDPRLGSTTPESLKLRDAEEISGPIYKDVIETNTNPVGGGGGGITFPRERRSTDRKSVKKRFKRQITGCFCAPIGSCTNGTSSSSTNFGAGVIDMRIVNGGTTSGCSSGLIFCCPTSSSQVSCGSRVQTNVNYPISNGQARYGDYPWMVVILTSDNMYVGGGSLIDLQHVLTAAHRVSNFPNGAGIKIRLGEWDAAGTYEQYPYRDYTVSRMWIHEQFNPSTLQNTIALIRMSSAVPAGTPAIVPICMPTSGQVFDGQRCWVSGWGKDGFAPTNQFQSILKAVDVPIQSQSTCESNLRTTKLGTAFVLDRAAFICAGGELNKDSCTGDGGSGLVCETSPGRWTLAGMVAWGVGCATQNIPAAYVNVANYVSWISSRQASP